MKKNILYKILIPLDKLVMSLYRVKYINKENIPKEGPIILAGNHTSHLDPLLLMSSTTRPIHFLAKIELCKGIKKYFFKGVGIIPVDRSKKNPQAIKLSEEYLLSKEVICIFPEATINRTKSIIMPFKYGTVKLAAKTNAKIIPFSITGKYKFLRPSITICFGTPYQVTKDPEKDNQILENKVINLIRSNKWKKNIKKVIYFLKVS